jgi:glycine betaine/proline transport system substrate-binding protein
VPNSALLSFNVDLENQIITNVLQNKVDLNTAALHALQSNPEMLTTWLKGVTTAAGADGLQAVHTSLGIR